MPSTRKPFQHVRASLAACRQCSPFGNHRTGRGFTLIEGMIASVVLAAITLAVMTAFTSAAQNSAEAEEATTAAELARQLLDEIAAKPVLDPNNVIQLLGPDAGESGRAQFDNVDDYHGYTDSTAQIRGLDSTTVMQLAHEYTRQVSVEFRRPPGTTTPRASADFVVVTVTIRVRPGADGTYTFERLFANVPRGGQ